MSKVAFKTIGCRLNQSETAQMAAQFTQAKWQIVPFEEASDVYIIHSCTITGKAERKSLLCARSIKKKYPDSIVVLAGCAVEANKDSHINNASIDILANQTDKFNLLNLINPLITPNMGSQPQGINLACRPGAPTGRALQQDPNPLSNPNPLIPRFSTKRALIKVQDGCDFCCSYCIVPTSRGIPTSRPFNEILNEIKAITENGFKEIVLTGANLGRYNYEDKNLADLLLALETIDSVKRIRLSSIEISTTERQILDHMAESQKLCKFIHIPLQSGDNNILKAMGRRYTTSEYRKTIEYAISKMPLLGLGTDIIIGFPGETDAHFQTSVRLINDLPFSNLHIFPYSKRSGTKAAMMSNQVSATTKKERCSILTELGTKKRTAFTRQLINKQVSVLIEKINSDGTGSGWTEEYIPARTKITTPAPNQIISFVPTKIENDTLC